VQARLACRYRAGAALLWKGPGKRERNQRQHAGPDQTTQPRSKKESAEQLFLHAAQPLPPLTPDIHAKPPAVLNIYASTYPQGPPGLPGLPDLTLAPADPHLQTRICRPGFK